MNKRLNLSGNAKVDFNLDANEFIEGVKDICSVSKFNNGNDMDRDGKFKLGLNEREFSITFEVDNKEVEVLVYLQLSLDNKHVKVIETFTGVDYFINVKEYYEKLSRSINNSPGNNVDLKFTFNGYSK